MALERERLVSIIRYIARLLSFLERGGAMPRLPEGVTYREVYTVARDHSVSSTIWYALEDEVSATGDEALIKRFERDRDIEMVKHIRQSAEFAMITARFTEEKIPFLPMKGFIIKALYPREEYRTMSDMDIYVSEEYAARAREVLLSLGYQVGHDDAVHDTFEKPPYINVELHRVLERGSQKSYPDWQQKADNPYWYTMSIEDTLAFLISHMYKHYAAGGCGARSVYDVHLYLKKYAAEIDEECLRASLNTEELRWFYDMVLRLSNMWFLEGGEPDGDLLDFEYYVLTGGTYGNMENKVEHSMRTKSRVGYIWRRAFPSYSAMKYVFPWLKRAPILLPLAWIVRLVGALFDGRMRREMRAMDAAEKKGREE